MVGRLVELGADGMLAVAGLKFALLSEHKKMRKLLTMRTGRCRLRIHDESTQSMSAMCWVVGFDAGTGYEGLALCQLWDEGYWVGMLGHYCGVL